MTSLEIDNVSVSAYTISTGCQPRATFFERSGEFLYKTILAKLAHRTVEQKVFQKLNTEQVVLKINDTNLVFNLTFKNLACTYAFLPSLKEPSVD